MQDARLGGHWQRQIDVVDVMLPDVLSQLRQIAKQWRVADAVETLAAAVVEVADAAHADELVGCKILRQAHAGFVAAGDHRRMTVAFARQNERHGPARESVHGHQRQRGDPEPGV